MKKWIEENRVLFIVIVVLVPLLVFGAIAYFTGVVEWLFGGVLGLTAARPQTPSGPVEIPPTISQEPAVKKAKERAKREQVKAKVEFDDKTSENKAAAPIKAKADLSDDIDKETSA